MKQSKKLATADYLARLYQEIGEHEELSGKPEQEFRRRYLTKLVNRYGYGRDVLEIGSGCGYMSPDFAAAAKSLSVVELSRSFAEKTKIKLAQTANAEVINADIYDLPFADRSKDVVVLLQVLEHLEHPSQALLEVRRCLRPGGVLIVGVPNTLRLRNLTSGYCSTLRPRVRMDVHLMEWGPALLSALLSMHGFDPESYFAVARFDLPILRTILAHDAGYVARISVTPEERWSELSRALTGVGSS